MIPASRYPSLSLSERNPASVSFAEPGFWCELVGRQEKRGEFRSGQDAGGDIPCRFARQLARELAWADQYADGDQDFCNIFSMSSIVTP